MQHKQPHPWKQKYVAVLLLVLIVSSSHTPVARASEFVPLPLFSAAIAPLSTQAMAVFSIPAKNTVIRSDAEIKSYVVDMTAYTSSVEETDDSPFITADGSHTRDGIVATNFLPFNTKIRIPELFGDRILEVHDRMNVRYWKRVDVWMEKKQDMRQFGIHHNVTIEIVEMGNGKKHWGELAAAKI